jgi:pimeloyl-ACP methyl ester carboxylesterase
MLAPTFAPTDRAPLIYLPGLDGTGRLLHRQPRLHARYDVHCVGYPQEDRHTYADLVACAAAPLEKAGPGVVLAESFGGAVALMLTLQRPELVRRLVLVNTFAYFPRRALIGLFAWLGRFFPPMPGHPATRPVRGIFFFSPAIPSEDRTQWWERTADVPLNAYGHRFQLIGGLDLRPRLSEVRTPALVLAAPDDRVVPVCAGRALARRLPNARLINSRVGHAALIHPQVDVAELLEDPRHWPDVSDAATALSRAGSRSG